MHWLTNHWLQLAGAVIIWLIGVVILTSGLKIKKESHKNKRVSDYSPSLGLGDFSIAGFIFDLIFSLSVGLIMKYSPWWFAKTLAIATGCGILYVGFLVLVT
jgi:putative Mn2+ efflux pump MntP